MALLDLYAIASKTYTKQALDTGSGVGCPEVTPFFNEWASAANVPPDGIGTFYACGWDYIFCIGTDLYAVVNEFFGTGRGIYKYSLNLNDDPITMTYVGMSSLSGMGLGDTFYIFGLDFDQNTQTALISTYTFNTAIPNSMGRWNISDWPWTSANAIWRNVPISYLSVISGQVAGYPINIAIDKTNNYLVLGSLYGAKADVFNYTTGAWLGEKVWDSTWSIYTHPVIIGLTPSKNVLVGGQPTYLHSGDVHAYDISNPASWSDQGKVYDKQGSNWNIGRRAGYRRPLPNWGYAFFGRIRNIGIGQHELLGWDTNSWSIIATTETYQGISFSSPGYIIKHNMTTDTWQEYDLNRAVTYQRTGLGIASSFLSCFCKIDDVLWYCAATQLSQDQLAEQPTGADLANGIMGVHADEAQVEYTFTVTTQYKPQVLSHSVAIGSRNSEFSDHPSKHAFRLSIDNGNSWTGWRSGNGLTNLQEVVDGDPIWPILPIGPTIKIQHKLTSGIINQYGEIHGRSDADTELVPCTDIGPPRNIRPILHVDPLSVLIGL